MVLIILNASEAEGEGELKCGWSGHLPPCGES